MIVNFPFMIAYQPQDKVPSLHHLARNHISIRARPYQAIYDITRQVSNIPGTFLI
tara:strand:- start:76 stop:240 length:165 start_codon:yes stop_codon:yes gene_type:complete